MLEEAGEPRPQRARMGESGFLVNRERLETAPPKQLGISGQAESFDRRRWTWSSRRGGSSNRFCETEKAIDRLCKPGIRFTFGLPVLPRFLAGHTVQRPRNRFQPFSLDFAAALSAFAVGALIQAMQRFLEDL